MNLFWTVSLFWIAAVVCIALALAFVLPTLLRARTVAGKAVRRDVNIAVYRDQMKEIEADRSNGLISEAQFQTAKLELEARLADDALTLDESPEPSHVGSRKLGYTLGAVLPVAAFGLYFWLGNPTSLIAIADAQSGPAQPAMTAAPGEHDFTKLIQKIEEKTQAYPDDGEAWTMLAKTYAAIERWPEALQAFEKAIKLLPQDASVLSGYAEALAITNNRVLTGRPMEWVRKALEIDPEDMKGLELAGINAHQEKNFAQAGNYFKRLHLLLPPESPYAQDILAAQKEAERLAQTGMTGLGNPANPPPADDKTASVAPGAAIMGSIDIAPALKSRLADTDVLFLFARTGQGGPPVAAIRASASQLPLEFELDDSTAMNPGNTLSQHKQVMLVARVSKSGNPMAQPGDLEGTVANVKVGATGVKIMIDQTRP
ncbi:MAG: c-type cytochrome biogenesis protein CcmI [Thiobacillus sp.]|nr:c-type cytochrome biogenesis protein CcmI [Thiobacillus sp.]MDP2056696.1 c-type cytochrome biogenesis protein CcmI [Thiobacillus sp.]